MNRISLALLTAGLLAPTVAAKSPPDAPAGQAAKSAADAARLRETERTEDVEVLRCILNKAFGLPDQGAVTTRVYLNSGRGITTADGQFHPGQDQAAVPNHLVGPFDGVYLPGHGVVYTLRVPAGAHLNLERPSAATPGQTVVANCQVCHAGAVSFTSASPDPHRPPSEWDQTRDALRGAPPPPPVAVTPQKVCEPGNAADVLATKLAAHVRRIRHLSAAERVTVVVTFDGAFGPAAAQPVPGTSGRRNLSFNPLNTLATEPQRAGGTAGPPRLSTGESVFTDDERKLLAAGDLHLKNGNPAAAVDSFRRALARIGTGPVRLPADQYRTLAQRFPQVLEDAKRAVTEARRKAATALLAAGNADEAKAMLDAALAVTVEADTGAVPSAADRLPVPAKLIVSLVRKQAEQAEDAARKAVTVETVGFPPAARTTAPEVIRGPSVRSPVPPGANPDK
ncbi:MAG: hypothetical protein U0871_24155 [Gemmataceae bacterium]